VFGHGERRHLQPRGLVEEFVDAAGTVEQRKFGVTVKMNEMLISHGLLGACLADLSTGTHCAKVEAQLRRRNYTLL
jgi:hypothetical protein